MTKKILIVDDESGVNYTVKHGLEALDKEYQVTCVESGEKCIELLEQNQLPDLILLDVMMPGMTGWEVQKKIKENKNWRQIPVVFLTARTDYVAKRAGEFLGDDYIGKPFKIPELKQRIDKVLQKK
jgi:CheY-like chemotaxis protein